MIEEKRIVSGEVSDDELARMAEWAERMEITTDDTSWKKAYGAIRQGSDWILRKRTLKRYNELTESNGKVSTVRKQ